MARANVQQHGEVLPIGGRDAPWSHDLELPECQVDEAPVTNTAEAGATNLSLCWTDG